jgi:hypothetical protein
MSVVKAQSLTDPTAEKTRLLVSDNGRRLILASPEEQSVAYRETLSNGWTELRHIHLDDSMNLDTAYAILRTRTARH